MAKHKVLIMRCDEYDPLKIAGIVKEAMEELGVNPRGRTLLKPNCVIAQPEIFPYAFTRKEFIEGVLIATKEKGRGIQELSVGERSGITIPTRFCFKSAGYDEVIRRHKVTAHYFDESRQVPVKLKRKERLREEIFVPKPIAECDFLINLPKFKGHPWTRLTLALKNYIGIQDDRHRLVDHNSYLEHKIADLQEVIQPGFIAIDAIVAGQKMMLTPTPFTMGAIVMGTNQCAVDTVGCHMVHVEPKDLVHLSYASERGYGPMSLDEIEVDGDFPLEEVRARTEKFELCLERIEDYFKDYKGVKCTVGTFPEKHSPEYCWGGCPGALQEAMHIFEGFDPKIDDKLHKIRYVVGKVTGPLDLEDDEKVIFAGDCTSWKGTLDGKEVDIKSTYKTASQVDVTKTKSNDMVMKILGPLVKCFLKRNSSYVHAAGCPVSVGDHVNYVATLGKVRNANFDPRTMIPVNIAYLQMRINRFLNRFMG